MYWQASWHNFQIAQVLALFPYFLEKRLSDVAIASVYSEKTRLKKFIMIIIIIMNKSQETTFFGGHQKLTSVMKLRPEKWW